MYWKQFGPPYTGTDTLHQMSVFMGTNFGVAEILSKAIGQFPHVHTVCLEVNTDGDVSVLSGESDVKLWHQIKMVPYKQWMNL